MASNAFYARNRGSNNRAAVVGEQVKIPSPVHEGVEHVFKMVVVDSNDIEGKTYKSPYNKRSADHLTLAAVIDIFTGIQRDGRNTHPAIGCYDKDGNIEILAGMRRRFSVSLLDDAKFYVLVADNLDEKEKAKMAITSDEYEEPTAIDIGFSICELRQAKVEKGESINREELAEIFDISTGKVSESVAFASLPSDLFSLFPSLSSISYRFLRKAVKLNKDSEQQFRAAIDSAIRSGLRVTYGASDTKADIRDRCKALENEILALSVPPKKSVKPPVTRWRKIKEKKGVSVKVSAKGVVSLQIDESKADEKTIDKIYELLAK